MVVNGLKKTVGDFKRLNAGGAYSSNYGLLMFDKSNGCLWVDEFSDLGHNSYVKYDSDTIVNLGKMMADKDVDVTMQNVRNFIDNEL